MSVCARALRVRKQYRATNWSTLNKLTSKSKVSELAEKLFRHIWKSKHNTDYDYDDMTAGQKFANLALAWKQAFSDTEGG